jgi:hypothetical protein
MVRIIVSDLNPAGSDLFSDAESLADSVKDLTAEELNATKGGGSKFKFKSGAFFGGFGGFGGGPIIINNNNNNNNGGFFHPAPPAPPIHPPAPPVHRPHY